MNTKQKKLDIISLMYFLETGFIWFRCTGNIRLLMFGHKACRHVHNSFNSSKINKNILFCNISLFTSIYL